VGAWVTEAGDCAGGRWGHWIREIVGILADDDHMKKQGPGMRSNGVCFAVWP